MNYNMIKLLATIIFIYTDAAYYRLKGGVLVRILKSKLIGSYA